MIKKVRTEELYDCQVPYLQKLFAESEYPWQMLPEIKGFINSDVVNALIGDQTFVNSLFANDTFINAVLSDATLINTMGSK